MPQKTRCKILTIEDEDIVRTNIVSYLEDSGYTVVQAENGKIGLDKFRNEKPDIVLLDLRMPEMSGLEVLAIIKKEAPEIPVIIVSGTGSIMDAVDALHLGAWDFVTKPIQEMAVLEHAIGKCMERSGLIRQNQSYQAHLEEEIKKRTLELETSSDELRELNKHLSREIKERILAEDKLIKSLDSLERSIEGTIRTISHIAEIRDPYTGGHQQRVASLSQAIAREMGLSDEEIQGVHVAAMLHDIGKISVPIEILVKPGNLSILEIMHIRNHPQTGYDILQMVDFPWPVAQIVLQHHERVDGSGYPQGLTGDSILLYAKIIGVADVVESMASHRPYRSALGIDEALAEITGNSANLYDARVVKACCEVFINKGFTFAEDTLDLMLRNKEVI